MGQVNAYVPDELAERMLGSKTKPPVSALMQGALTEWLNANEDMTPIELAHRQITELLGSGSASSAELQLATMNDGREYR